MRLWHCCKLDGQKWQDYSEGKNLTKNSCQQEEKVEEKPARVSCRWTVEVELKHGFELDYVHGKSWPTVVNILAMTEAAIASVFDQQSMLVVKLKHDSMMTCPCCCRDTCDCFFANWDGDGSVNFPSNSSDMMTKCFGIFLVWYSRYLKSRLFAFYLCGNTEHNFQAVSLTRGAGTGRTCLSSG